MNLPLQGGRRVPSGERFTRAERARAPVAPVASVAEPGEGRTRAPSRQEGTVQLRDLGEFALIARIERAARGASKAGVALGIGDDAALLRARPGETWAVSTDARIEGVHFRFRSETPRTVGETALAAAL